MSAFPSFGWGGLHIIIADVPARGTIIMHHRDWEDAFTHHPTRTHFEHANELREMEVMAEKMAKLLEGDHHG